MKYKAVVLTFLVVANHYAQQATNSPRRLIREPQHFYKAEDYLHMTEREQELYASGMLDGFLGSAFLGASDERLDHLRECTRNMSSAQVSAIIEKYIKEHPEDWNSSASVNAYSAFMTYCPKLGQSVAPNK